ncbi:MAG: RNA polymerase sigma factor [Acidimicrobiales bacterium]
MDPRVSTAVAEAHRKEWAFVLAATVRVTADLDLAEECVQHAYAKALESWARAGIPTRPGAWLTTTARRRAIDLLRRSVRERGLLPLLVEDANAPDPQETEHPDIPDDRLRLIFTCCHPALGQPAQVALTLRLVCGLTTTEVARAFLVPDPTMAARITRAKRKIATARIPFRVPTAEELPEKLDPVLEVVHLLFATGHTAPAGDDLVRTDLVQRAGDLARMLHALLPASGEVRGLLALILLTGARSPSRVDDSGRLVLLAEQDRSRWDGAAIDEGLRLLERTSADSRFALMAAIAAVHARSGSWGETDWTRIVELYDALIAVWPSPVVELNRAVAVGLAEGPQAGLDCLEPLLSEPQLAGYAYLSASRADFLRQVGRVSDARLAYEEALMLSANAVEREFLAERLRALDDASRVGDTGEASEVAG